MATERFDPLKDKIFQVIDENGKADPELDPSLPPEELKKIYNLMVMTRATDIKALELQREGRMGTYAPDIGHEGCQVGGGMAVQNGDWTFPHFRDLGLFLALGFPLKNFFLYWMGNEMGNQIPLDLNIFPMAIPAGAQIPQAVGAGMAIQLKGQKKAVLCCFDGGATSEGDFHEALNFAGVFKTPNVFLCTNNQSAFSLPCQKQTAPKTLAQKSSAYGFTGVVIDGNDPLSVFISVREALEKARNGGGPTLIEAVTYRIGDRTSSDDSSRNRSEEEVGDREKKDPITRFQGYLKGKELWNEQYEKGIQEKTAAFIDRAVEEAEETPLPSVPDIFQSTYKITPPYLRRQLDEFQAFLEEKDR